MFVDQVFHGFQIIGRANESRGDGVVWNPRAAHTKRGQTATEETISESHAGDNIPQVDQHVAPVSLGPGERRS